jgi:hypothetical protein
MAEGKKKQSENQQGQNQHLERLNQQLQAYLQAQSDYQAQLQRAQVAQQAGAKDISAPSEPTPSHELSDYLFARSLLAQYEAQTGKKLQPSLIGDAALASVAAIGNMTAPGRRELHELWSAGMQEVFGKRRQSHVPPGVQSATTKQQPNSFEINPVSVVFSRLPMAIHNRRFSRPMPKLSSASETIAG